MLWVRETARVCVCVCVCVGVGVGVGVGLCVCVCKACACRYDSLARSRLARVQAQAHGATHLDERPQPRADA